MDLGRGSMGTAVDVRFGSRVDGALARAFFTFAALVGAAMCSACSCGTRKAAGHNALRGSGPGQIQDTAIAMSALPPKADICSAQAHVRFGSIVLKKSPVATRDVH